MRTEDEYLYHNMPVCGSADDAIHKVMYASEKGIDKAVEADKSEYIQWAKDRDAKLKKSASIESMWDQFDYALSQNDAMLISVGDNLNLGCGYKKYPGTINVDFIEDCEPDRVVDLNQYPWPWPDQTIDNILGSFLFEYLDDWWAAVGECARILKPGGFLELRMTHESNSEAGTQRFCKHIFTPISFYGIRSETDSMIILKRGSNAWAQMQEDVLPFAIVLHRVLPFKEYLWLTKFPKTLWFLSKHCRNFINEQRYIFRKVG